MHRRRWVVAAAVFALFCGESQSASSRTTAAFREADSLAAEGRAALATPRYLVLRDSFATLGDTTSWWRAQLWLSEGLLRQGKRDTALVELEKASRLAVGSANRTGWTRFVRSIFMDRVGHFDSALTEASSAAVIARETRDPKLEARAYHALGRIHSLSGRYTAALASNSRALAIENASGATLRETSLELSELGIDYRHLGRFTEAVAAYDSALKIGRLLGNPEGIARVEFNLATIRTATGEVDEAMTLLNDALVRAEQIGEVRGVAFIHGGLADLYFRSKAYVAARQHFERALEINRLAKLPYGQVQNLEGLGRVDLAEGRTRAALPALRAALAIADSAPYGKERSTTRASLARAYAASGARKQALRWADEAVHIADSIGDPAVQLEARAARGVTLEAARDANASDAYLSAIDLLESWRGRLALGDLRMGVADPHLDVYEGAIRTLLVRGRTAEAFEVAERARARLLLELMAHRDVQNADRSREDSVRQALREKFSAREERNDSAAARADREIALLTRALDSTELAARARDARAGVTYPKPAGARALQTSLLKEPGRGLLMFFWGEQDVYGWWMTGDKISAARLGQADTLAALIDFLHGALSRPERKLPWQPAAHTAFARLVAPLAPSDAAEVLVVADGPLAYTPLETLIPDHGAWGSNTRFVYGPSASVLLSLQQLSSAPRWTRGVLAVGNPARRPNAGRTIASAAERSFNSLLPDLPAAESEARQIVSLLGGDAIVGQRATLAHWLSLDPARYRYLHFATHTLFDDEHPQRTALLMADGRLDLEGVRRLRISSELVTLSACETAVGRQLRGEGVIGLPHAFLEAGARGVVMSLWRVSDQIAASYMEEFYRELRDGRTPAEAMLAVRKRRIQAGGAASHPSQWAAFVLVGGITPPPAAQ